MVLEGKEGNVVWYELQQWVAMGYIYTYRPYRDGGEGALLPSCHSQRGCVSRC